MDSARSSWSGGEVYNSFQKCFGLRYQKGLLVLGLEELSLRELFLIVFYGMRMQRLFVSTNKVGMNRDFFFKFSNLELLLTLEN